MALTDQQLAAAELLARGSFQNRVAEQLAVSPKTIRRWRDIPDFQLAIAKAQEQALDPSVEGTLRAALTATRKDGGPDWPTRVAAARALAQLGKVGEPTDDPDEEPARPRAVIYERVAV